MQPAGSQMQPAGCTVQPAGCIMDWKTQLFAHANAHDRGRSDAAGGRSDTAGGRSDTVCGFKLNAAGNCFFA